MIETFGGASHAALRLGFHDVELNGDHVADSVVVLGAGADVLTRQGWPLERLAAHNDLTASHQVVGDWLVWARRRKSGQSAKGRSDALRRGRTPDKRLGSNCAGGLALSGAMAAGRRYPRRGGPVGV